MLQLRSILSVADNSGAKSLMVIGIPHFSQKHTASLGDVVKAVALEVLPTGQVKKGDKVSAVIVRIKKEKRRLDGSYIRFSDNAGVIINNVSGVPLGSRIFGPVAREVREAGFKKVVSLAKEVV